MFAKDIRDFTFGGQYDSHFIHKPQGWNQGKEVIGFSHRNMEMVHSEGHYYSCRAPSWLAEYICRQSLKGQMQFQRLAIGWSSFPGTNEKVGDRLICSRHNTHLPLYFNFSPDPEALAFDALAQSWTGVRAYAFPPFILIGRVLQKILNDNPLTVILIVPAWPSQSWYPQLLYQAVEIPILLPMFPMLLTNPLGEPHPLVLKGDLRLTAWKVSGNPMEIKEFQTKLSRSFQHHGEKGLRNHMQLHGENGVTGVMAGKLIPFHRL